ncbi:TetR/AcrR family transcriptional regulator [Nonomuraea lactucae]|uniref:TetR/AcrR family transcriptional regulator n=1 Tax=Nonomuraea lactucae TaxID=2249762 RepID=UPI0013B419CD|nr:TetR/AcrR family transcriptional regulator [Nonomuraea lactucae]
MARRREVILDAAAACIVRDGLAGFSTTSLCQEAGISTGALYRHFASREDILIGLTERAARVRRLLLDSASFAGFRASLVALLKTFTTDEGRFLARLDLELASAAAVNADVAKALQPFLVTRDFETALVELRGAGELDPGTEPATLAKLLTTLLAGYVYLFAVGDGIDLDPEQIVDTVLAP